jgi:hypothetical protein
MPLHFMTGESKNKSQQRGAEPWQHVGKSVMYQNWSWTQTLGLGRLLT